MNVLVAFGSHLGSTEAIAGRIAAAIRAEGADVTLRAAASPEPVDRFDAFVVGGGTYAGKWHADAVAFVRNHAEALAAKPVWLFSSGPLGATGGSAEPHPPSEMSDLVRLVHARDHAIFAGAYDRSHVDESELGRLEKFVAKRFIPEGDWRDWPTIEAWAHRIARDLVPGAIGAL
ncbi:MAG: flavodoxin [Chloroflexi bacterium]|nr:flavodoxin [Chloroflexota bacterium]